MTVRGTGPEIVDLSADGLETFADLAVAAHVIPIAIYGLPAGRHGAVAVKIVFPAIDGGKT